MKTKRTRFLHSSVPFWIGAGFGTRMALSGAPISIDQSLYPYATAWAWSLILLAAAATALSLKKANETTLILGAAVRVILGFWALAAAVAFFFRREAGNPFWSEAWWRHRDYSLIGAVIALAFAFFASAWDLTHFHLASIRAQKNLVTRIEELRSSVPPEE